MSEREPTEQIGVRVLRRWVERIDVAVRRWRAPSNKVVPLPKQSRSRARRALERAIAIAADRLPAADVLVILEPVNSRFRGAR